MVKEMGYLDELQDYICEQFNCTATHLESVPVFERYDPSHYWKGWVEVFSLQGYSEASKCYAWSLAVCNDCRDERFIAVRHIPPNDTPQKAVRALLERDIKTELEAAAKQIMGENVTLGPIQKATMGDLENEGVQRLRGLFGIQGVDKDNQTQQ